MGYTAAPLEKLIEEFSKFPGIGRKGATRMAYQVLSMSDEDAAALAGAIQGAHTKLHRCRICQNYTEADICPICASAKRDPSVICVVETPRDVQAFERTREYHGLYHVLHGLLSPMDGITAEQLCVKELLARLGDGKVKEVIMAMNPTVEGEATAMYLAKLIKPLGTLPEVATFRTNPSPREEPSDIIARYSSFFPKAGKRSTDCLVPSPTALRFPPQKVSFASEETTVILPWWRSPASPITPRKER